MGYYSFTAGEVLSASTLNTVTGVTGWVAYTPTPTNVTTGNGTYDFAYFQIGKTVFVRGRFTLGSTSAVTGAATFSLPVTASIAGNYGSAVLRAAATDYVGIATTPSTTTVLLSTSGAASTYTNRVNTSATIPATWANGDIMSFTLIYQAA
jgi:hypothetical protein